MEKNGKNKTRRTRSRKEKEGLAEKKKRILQRKNRKVGNWAQSGKHKQNENSLYSIRNILYIYIYIYIYIFILYIINIDI